MLELITAKATIGKALVPPLIPVAMFAAGEGHNIINENTLLPFTVVISIGAALWYLQGRFTRIEAKLDSHSEKIESLSKRLESRPCTMGSDCPPVKKPHWAEKLCE